MGRVLQLLQQRCSAVTEQACRSSGLMSLTRLKGDNPTEQSVHCFSEVPPQTSHFQNDSSQWPRIPNTLSQLHRCCRRLLWDRIFIYPWSRSGPWTTPTLIAYNSLGCFRGSSFCSLIYSCSTACAAEQITHLALPFISCSFPRHYSPSFFLFLLCCDSS